VWIYVASLALGLRGAPRLARPRVPAPPSVRANASNLLAILGAPPLPSRTNWTSLVPLPVLTGHASNLLAILGAARSRHLRHHRTCNDVIA